MKHINLSSMSLGHVLVSHGMAHVSGIKLPQKENEGGHLHQTENSNREPLP